MYTILKLIGLSIDQLHDLQNLMRSDPMMTRSFYWGEWESGRTGLGAFRYAKILNVKRDKPHNTCTVEIKLMHTSETVRIDSTGPESPQLLVQVLTPAYVLPYIMRLVEPRSFNDITIDAERTDIVVPICGPNIPFIDLSGLIKLEIRAGLTIKLYRRKGEDAFFQIVNRGWGQPLFLSLSGPGKCTETLPWTSSDKDLDTVAARFRWKGKVLRLTRDLWSTDSFLEGEWAHFDIKYVG